jgi:hypothetical protein
MKLSDKIAIVAVLVAIISIIVTFNSISTDSNNTITGDKNIQISGEGNSIHYEIKKKKDNIPSYSGEFGTEFARFVETNLEHIFYLSLDFNEDESASLCKAFCWKDTKEETVWMSAPLDDAGIEFGFSNLDSELYMNTRHRENIFTEGYFKVLGISGPRQGWMSFMLRAVGKEHIQK